MSAALERNAFRGGEHVHGRETLLNHTSKPIVRLVESSGERSGTFFPTDMTEYAFRKGNSTDGNILQCIHTF